MQKQTCFDKEIQPKMKKINYHHLIFVQYKKGVNLLLAS
jgi:hypothetical protein